ncbi:RHS domain-containing protein [Pseudomonas sp. NGC7]|uniref:RHS domain-containing protein n=1 Tax=Pseudomonas sp. NGC7 TaxID=3341775 RepID=UPI00399C5160
MGTFTALIGIPCGSTSLTKIGDAFAWYQCDQLGTPMELTDVDGEVTWRGFYWVWGLAEQKQGQK